MSSTSTHSPAQYRPVNETLPQRMGGILGLVAFAFSLLTGLFEADNPFSTIVLRAIVAMVVTVFVGYLLGWVAQAMLNENVRTIEEAEEKSAEAEISAKDSATDGR
ncbi:MAG: hypothetical protein QM770_22560 [Tepidisphaeraceae bacterium]